MHSTELSTQPDLLPIRHFTTLTGALRISCERRNIPSPHPIHAHPILSHRADIKPAAMLQRDRSGRESLAVVGDDFLRRARPWIDRPHRPSRTALPSAEAAEKRHVAAERIHPAVRCARKIVRRAANRDKGNRRARRRVHLPDSHAPVSGIGERTLNDADTPCQWLLLRCSWRDRIVRFAFG